MPSNWTKQPQQKDRNYLNDGNGDVVIGGSLTTVPSNVAAYASMGNQNIPGDRIIFGASDALAMSDVSGVGTLYCGIYMYVATLASGGGTPTLGHLAFWDPTAFSVATSNPSLDNLYRVTAAELASGTGITPPLAGVFINPITAGNYWWIQIGGKATMSFGPLAGSQYGTASSYAINKGVYAGGYGNTAGAGLVTQVNGDTFPTTDAQLDAMINGYIGTAETAPTASANSIVDFNVRTYRF